jgi:hypothetical protein
MKVGLTGSNLDVGAQPAAAAEAPAPEEPAAPAESPAEPAPARKKRSRKKAGDPSTESSET